MKKSKKNNQYYSDAEAYSFFVKQQQLNLAKESLEMKSDEITDLDVLIENCKLQVMNNPFGNINTFNLLVKKIKRK